MLSYLIKSTFLTCFVLSDISGLIVVYLGLTMMEISIVDIISEYNRIVKLKSGKHA